jgi:hypothetical protein
MQTIPIIRSVSNFEAGIYLNYGGQSGMRFAVPCKTSGEYKGRAIVFGGAQSFEEASIGIEQSFLLPGTFILLPPLQELSAGIGKLTPGCVAPIEGRVALSYSDPFGDVEWLDLATGVSLEAKSSRYFFETWRVAVRDADGGLVELFSKVQQNALV